MTIISLLRTQRKFPGSINYSVCIVNGTVSHSLIILFKSERYHNEKLAQLG